MNCFTTQNSGGTYVPSPGCNEVALAFHPRIPRYGRVGHDRERLGITGSVKWAPTERTKISVDGLFSRYRETRSEQWAEVHWEERFAESYSFLLTDPRLLQQLRPHTFAWFVANLPGGGAASPQPGQRSPTRSPGLP